MCTYDFDWYGSYERRTLDRDTRCSCGRRIPAGTDHRVLVENVEDVRCILCDGDGRGPLVDDYGNVIRYSAADVRFARFLHDNYDVLTRTAIYDEFDLERPCPAPGCIDGYSERDDGAHLVACSACDWTADDYADLWGHVDQVFYDEHPDLSIEVPKRDLRALLAERERLRGLVAAAHQIEWEDSGDYHRARFFCTACDWDMESPSRHGMPGVMRNVTGPAAGAAHVADVLEGRAS